jgi:hypothetical protein
MKTFGPLQSYPHPLRTGHGTGTDRAYPRVMHRSPHPRGSRTASLSSPVSLP